MEIVKMDKDLIKLAEKIIDQNDKISSMNGMILESLSKPHLVKEHFEDSDTVKVPDKVRKKAIGELLFWMEENNFKDRIKENFNKECPTIWFLINDI